MQVAIGIRNIYGWMRVWGGWRLGDGVWTDGVRVKGSQYEPIPNPKQTQSEPKRSQSEPNFFGRSFFVFTDLRNFNWVRFAFLVIVAILGGAGGRVLVRRV